MEMIDWAALFVPKNPVAEVILRGTLIYLLLFLVLRFFMNRQAGAVGIPDILVVVLIVEATTDALGRNESVTEAGLVISSVSAGEGLVEIIELPDHPFYVGAQFHPEFQSKPNHPHPLFAGFVAAALEKSAQ